MLVEVMARVRANPPVSLGGVRVSEVVDLEAGCNGLAATEGLIWRLGDIGRVVVRPSGTEPKLKAYLEVVDDASHDDLASARERCSRLLDALRRDLGAILSLEAVATSS